MVYYKIQRSDWLSYYLANYVVAHLSSNIGTDFENYTMAAESRFVSLSCFASIFLTN